MFTRHILEEASAEEAQTRMEEMLCLSVLCLADVTHVSEDYVAAEAHKQLVNRSPTFIWVKVDKVAATLAELMTKKENKALVSEYMLLLHHPSTCFNVLKVSERSTSVNQLK